MLKILMLIFYDCGAPNNIANGVATAPTTDYNSQASFTCETGYDLSASVTLTCSSSGSWTGTYPSCNPKDCGSLSAPVNGSINLPGTTYGNVATFTCDAGYDIVGSEYLSCDSDGQWNGTVPSCNQIDCGPLIPPADGSVSTIEGTTFPNIANYSCTTGYIMNGSNTRQCESNGSWGEMEPTCSIADCGPLPSPLNGQVSLPGGTTYNNVATYTCYTGYTLSSTHTRTCQGDTTWSGYQPACIIPGSLPQNIYIVPCLCYANKTFTNLTQEEIVQELIAATAINLKNTTSARSKLGCRDDSRVSSTTIGLLGAGILGALSVFLLITDSIKICKACTTHGLRMKQYKND